MTVNLRLLHTGKAIRNAAMQQAIGICWKFPSQTGLSIGIKKNQKPNQTNHDNAYDRDQNLNERKRLQSMCLRTQVYYLQENRRRGGCHFCQNNIEVLGQLINFKYSFNEKSR